MTERGQTMETNTRPAVELTDSLLVEGSVVLAHRVHHKLMSAAVLTREELQAFVQQAHDVYGITADPFATPHSAEGCPDPCRHDNECPHGRSNVAGETCPACVDENDPWRDAPGYGATA